MGLPKDTQANRVGSLRNTRDYNWPITYAGFSVDFSHEYDDLRYSKVCQPGILPYLTLQAGSLPIRVPDVSVPHAIVIMKPEGKVR